MTHTLWHGCTGSVGVRVVKEDVCVFMTICACVYGGWGTAACQEGPVCISREAQRGKILSGACLGHCFPHSVCSIARRRVRGETSGSVPRFCQALNASNTFFSSLEHQGLTGEELVSICNISWNYFTAPVQN